MLCMQQGARLSGGRAQTRPPQVAGWNVPATFSTAWQSVPHSTSGGGGGSSSSMCRPYLQLVCSAGKATLVLVARQVEAAGTWLVKHHVHLPGAAASEMVAHLA